MGPGRYVESGGLPPLWLSALVVKKVGRAGSQTDIPDGGCTCPTVAVPVQRKLRQAELPKVRFHDLRHACSSLLQARGISPKVVQEQLGHSNLSMTLRYTKVLPELAEAAARRMEEVLAGAVEPDDGGSDSISGSG
jgi:Phage integrase family